MMMDQYNKRYAQQRNALDGAMWNGLIGSSPTTATYASASSVTS